MNVRQPVHVSVPAEDYARNLMAKNSAESILRCIVAAKDDNNDWLLAEAIEFARKYFEGEDRRHDR